MEPQLIKNFAAAAFCAFKDFGTSSEGECNTSYRAHQDWANFQHTGNWERFWPGSSVTLLCNQATDSGSKRLEFASLHF